MKRETLDVVVIGGGPGGYVAALRAAQMGGKVVLIEKNAVGGTCLNRGCVPTKALFASVEKLNSCREAPAFGVEVGPPSANWRQMMARKDQIVQQMVQGVGFLLQRAGVRTIEGYGSLVEPGLVKVDCRDGSTEYLRTRAVIIATGSEPAELPGFPFDGERIIDSTQALRLQEIPPSLMVVGGGAIGLEFASIFNALGTKVVLVEMLGQVLPGEDEEVAALLASALTTRGVKIVANARVTRVEHRKGEAAVELSTGKSIKATKVLVAVGRDLNTRDVGLETIGVAFEGRRVKVNQRMETNLPGVYAVGDVVGEWLLAHVATRQGIVAALNAMGTPSRIDYRAVPRTVWSLPETASVGMTEQQAVQAGHTVRVGRFPFPGLAKALAAGQTDGLVKLVGDARTDELLGAQMIGHGVTDLIAEAATAMQLETTVEELANTIHAHPTLPEAVMEAAWVLRGQPIHF